MKHHNYAGFKWGHKFERELAFIQDNLLAGLIVAGYDDKKGGQAGPKLLIGFLLIAAWPPANSPYAW